MFCRYSRDVFLCNLKMCLYAAIVKNVFYVLPIYCLHNHQHVSVYNCDGMLRWVVYEHPLLKRILSAKALRLPRINSCNAYLRSSTALVGCFATACLMWCISVWLPLGEPMRSCHISFFDARNSIFDEMFLVLLFRFTWWDLIHCLHFHWLFWGLN